MYTCERNSSIKVSEEVLERVHGKQQADLQLDCSIPMYKPPTLADSFSRDNMLHEGELPWSIFPGAIRTYKLSSTRCR